MAEDKAPSGGGGMTPTVPIRGIRMKFAVLEGLVEAGEVMNRDIVETVFNLLVGGQFDLEMNFVIQETESIVCMVALLDKCEVTCQAEVWSMFTAVLKKSVRNMQACTDVGLITLVLQRIDRTDSMIADLLVDMLGVLASYSITVKELKLYFSKLQGEKGQWPPHAVKLLSVLKSMAHRSGPDAFFTFPGKSAAAIALPPIAKWPYQNGFTFHTWLRLDPMNNINVDKDKPYLYCFRTSKAMGYSAHFVGGCLIVTALKAKGKGFQHCVKFDFKPQKWYMVTIVHIYHRWKNSEISCYVNGELASFGEITWFVNTSDTFDKCFLGSAETADANRVFCGQMGAVYLFNDALNAAQIFAIYQLGPSYKGVFKYKAESDLLFADHHKSLLYDGKLSSSIAFTYNPRATDAQLCLESSPRDNMSIFIHSPHALMLQDVKAVVTHSVQSAVHSIGGVQVLFPLFTQLDFVQPNSEEPDISVSCTLLSFLLELLKSSVAMQEQILTCKGFLVVGYSLEKSSKVHVMRPVLDIILSFARYLSNLPNGILLLKQLCDHILFNPAIWIHTPAKVQQVLYTYLATEFISTVTIYNAVRRVGTVLQVMHTLKYYYWVVNPQDRSGVIPKGLDGPRPNQKEILSLRAFLLLFVKQLIMKDLGVKEDELQSILNYLLTMHEDDNLMDVLQLLVALMSEHPSSMVQAFDQRNGIRVIYKLLASKSEGIRVQALKVLGYFLRHLQPKRKCEVMLSHGLFSLLTERLLLHSSQFSMTTYNVLFEVMTEQICTQVIHRQHPEPDSTIKIQNPQILKVIAALLKNSTCPDSMEIRRVFLSDMIKLFNSSRENRRSLLQCSVWQEWMLSLCFINPSSGEELKITEMVYTVFRILLYHAIKHEWGGWRVWVDTLSITHSKVTFEQHKESLSHVFHEYQRMGSDGDARVRTVSGSSRNSELSAEPAQTPLEPPSTIIELKVEEQICGEHDEHEERAQVTVSNILARAEEEDMKDEDEKASVQKKQDEGESEAPEETPKKEEHDQEAVGGKDTEREDVEEKTDAGKEVDEDKSEADDRKSTEASSQKFEDDPEANAEKISEKQEDQLGTADEMEMTSDPGEGGNESERGEAPEKKDEIVEALSETSVHGDGEEREQREEKKSEISVEGPRTEESPGVEKGPDIEVQADVEVSPSTEVVLSGDKGPSVQGVPSAHEGQEGPSVEKSPNSQEVPSVQESPSAEVSPSTEEGSSIQESPSAEKSPSEQDGPSVQESPSAEKSPSPQEGPSVQESPSAEKSPSPPEGPSVQESPSAETSPSTEEGPSAQGVPSAEASPSPQDGPGVSESPSVETGFKPKDIKIARLDVSSVAIDTERLELKGTSAADGGQAQGAAGTSAQNRDGSASSSRSSMFRIPEFKWSHMHQRLLTDLLFSIETDVQMWRSHSTKTVMDFVNSSENVVFVHNTVHLISQVLDNLIMASGGILPLLSAATSSTHELEVIDASQGLEVEASLSFLQRLISLVDVLILSSTLNFTEIEAEKNMTSGGVLRQCLRLVCTMAVRSCLECQHQSRCKAGIEKTQQGLLGNAKFIPAQSPVDMLTGRISPISDVELLLQDMDINRLRAIVFRDIDDSKQAQFLALAVVYFISVLMVSKYRDILEPHNDKRVNTHTSRSTESVSSDLEKSSPLQRRDSAPRSPVAPSASEAHSAPDAISEALSTLSSEVKGHEDTDKDKKGKSVKVKDILRSLVSSAPADDVIVDASLLPPTFLGKQELHAQFSSFDRSVVVASKKAGGAPSAGPAPSSSSSSSIVPQSTTASSGGTPVINVAVVSAGDSAPSGAVESGGAEAASNLPSVPLSPTTTLSISERLEHALEKAAPLLREIFVDFAPFLSRTLLGSHGQELLIEGTSLVCMKSSSSVVELVMLLCSQEWQNSIQKNAGLAFIELVNEGRLLSHTMKDHLVRVANEAEFILSRQRAEDIHKHADFESHCAQNAAEKREEEKMCDHLIRAAKYRDHVTATQLIQKIINILTDKHGAWGSSAHSKQCFWRLDFWEDDLRRRRRLIRNPFGSSHSEATLKSAAEHAPGDDVLKGQQLRKDTARNQSTENESLTDGDDDTISSLEEKELDSLTGTVSFSTVAELVSPALVMKGTLSITANELYFEVDEDEANFKSIDPKLLAYADGLHGKWMFSEMRAIFSRRFLLQNTALEIFMASRTSVMFNFADAATVKKVVYVLPRVGVGTNFGLPQTRRLSLATPKQLFKASNMTQRWQKREISNFEYLMFLNTIAGRTYNDLNQYPVFPWIISNYDSEELDLTLPSNYRDLSKPIGALNPKRAAFFSERHESWEDEQVPKFHYGTHYSTASFTMMWLLRIEPFTTFFLNFQGGKFDHADRTFSSIARAWRNCQRDTSDVKELIPEFFYLPEMFINANDYNLGVMDDGTVVGDVELPPWAKSPEDFVRINRMALESEFVSCQLHQWVDLIFGYKQRGPEAARALNVYYYLTYEGAVNLSSITDPLLREAVESQIRSFGQTPSQLLIEPHPPRSSAMQMTPMMFTEQMQQDVIMVLKFPSNSPVVYVSAHTQAGLANSAIVTVTANRIFSINKWHGLSGHQSSSNAEQQYQLPVEIDPVIVSNLMHRRQVCDLLDQSVEVNSHCFLVSADNRFLFIAGFWDKSFRIYNTDTGKLVQIVFGHRDVVTSVFRSESYIGGDCYVLSGSRDATLLLWYWSGKHCCIGNTHSEFVTPRAILTGHDCEVSCASVCAELGVVISGSKDGPCLLHSVSGELLRVFESSERPMLMQASAEGHCVIYYTSGHVCVYSINGKLLCDTHIEDNIRAMLLSSNGQYLLCGGERGVLTVWQLHDLKQLFSYPGCDAAIRSMALTTDQRCIITGMASGSIVLFYNDFNRWHHEYRTRY
ncbi:lipopolysaccharide-responsive and beige-like anchor protein [Ictalurus punctatus]|uniref:Lipopolysaccharide-responsive and beige-like anchor protein n=1 Tax=Ictalurus punctatus TaxID=7998 RepID=A0A9F7R1X9_ICTPU|nr:lipopolysaccharide-responsive and beige-like anchor protein [Ictalurus punctatus]XP_053533644.1 lipopolysaccharide-responsive and beige-like anchor protein [Ictalurus punctatus]XP_053533645.1 lipopolysaccharide-responsive and beige-like anchor protein [Ictalurus punctatus]XP_053533646.1 lipopolysaccharide-responsive and beige-like anchor protein [Ictalurus punctatus]